jgi:hypothetical protein
MPRIRIDSIQGLERFAGNEQLRIDWLAPHPDWLHSLVDRSLGRFLGAVEEHWSVYPEESAAAEPGQALEALNYAGFDLWATSNGPWTRFFLTQREPADRRWSGRFCPWCPDAGPISG